MRTVWRAVHKSKASKWTRRINKRPNSTTEYIAQRLAQARTEANTARNNSGQRHTGLRRQQQPPATICQAVNPQTRPKASRWQGNNVRATPRQPSLQGRGPTRSSKTRPARKNKRKKEQDTSSKEKHTRRTERQRQGIRKALTRIIQLHRWASGALEKHTAVPLFSKEKTSCPHVSSAFLWELS